MSVTEMPGFPWVPYIPCPETPEARREELELQIRNMSALLTTIHEYLQDNKTTIDRMKQMKLKHETCKKHTPYFNPNPTV